MHLSLAIISYSRPDADAAAGAQTTRRRAGGTLEIATLRCGERLGSPMVDVICALQHDAYCGSPMLSACAANREYRKIWDRLKKGEGRLRWPWRDASQLLCHLMTRPSASSISSSRGLLKAE
jgi:hypothetical protein